MTAGRRPFASRGIARRRSTLPRGSARRAPRLIGLFAIVLVGGVGLAWTAGGLLPGSSAPNQPSAPTPLAKPTPGGDLQLAQLQGETPPAGAATPQPRTRLRAWDASAPGISIDPLLVERLDQVLAGVDGNLSVAVKDLSSGRGAVFDGSSELAAASLFKLPIMYAVYESGVPLSQELPISEEARAFDTGTLELGVGETLTVAEALERMVTLSDNTSAIMLGTRVGASNVTADITGLGLTTTHYSIDRMTTSALDMLHLVELVARGKAVSISASADMLHLLLRQRVNDRLPRLLPDGVLVAHKTGNLPGTVNDVGIVFGPRVTLAVAVLVSDTSDEPGAATAIARVAQATYGYFDDGASASTARVGIPPAPARAIPPVHRDPKPAPTPTPTPIEVEPAPSVVTAPASQSASTPTAAPATPTAVRSAPPTPTLAATQKSVAGEPTPRPTQAPSATLTSPPPLPTATRAPGRAPAPGTPEPTHR